MRHRKSVRRGNLSRTFWIRNTGLLQNQVAAQPAQMVLFDPLQMNPSATDQRADIARSITVMAIKFNFSAIFDVAVSTGTSESVVGYFGIAKTDRDIAPAVSPSFSAARDARQDWMAAWVDTYFLGNVGAPKRVVGQMTLGQANHTMGCQINIRTKRRMESQDVITLHDVYFGQLGTLTGTYNLTVQWQASILCKEG